MTLGKRIVLARKLEDLAAELLDLLGVVLKDQLHNNRHAAHLDQHIAHVQRVQQVQHLLQQRRHLLHVLLPKLTAVVFITFFSGSFSTSKI